MTDSHVPPRRQEEEAVSSYRHGLAMAQRGMRLLAAGVVSLAILLVSNAAGAQLPAIVAAPLGIVGTLGSLMGALAWSRGSKIKTEASRTYHGSPYL